MIAAGFTPSSDEADALFRHLGQQLGSPDERRCDGNDREQMQVIVDTVISARIARQGGKRPANSAGAS